MNTRTKLLLFFLGWATYSFSLFNVGPYSITLLLIASVLIFRMNFRSPILLASLLASGALCAVVSFYAYEDHGKTISHLMQYAICLGIFVGCMEFDMEKHFDWLRRFVLVLGTVVLTYGVYQFVARLADLPFAFLPITNLQLGADEGFQRGYSNIYLGADAFTRVSSFFAEPSDMGRFMLWIYAFGNACRERGLKIALSSIGIAGILISQSLGAVVGVAVLAITATLLKRDARECAIQAVLFGVIACGVLCFSPQISKTLSNRIVGIARDHEAYLAQAGRFRDSERNMDLFYQSPWLGHGIASIKRVAPRNVISNTCMVVLIERGLVGTLAFFLPFAWAFFQLAIARRNLDEVTQTALYLLIVELYCMTTFGAMYFPPVYFALAFAVARAHAVRRAETEVPGIEIGGSPPASPRRHAATTHGIPTLGIHPPCATRIWS